MFFIYYAINGMLSTPKQTNKQDRNILKAIVHAKQAAFIDLSIPQKDQQKIYLHIDINLKHDKIVNK